MIAGDFLAGLIAQAVRREGELIEEACERSLVDPDGRGVLIERSQRGTTVRLSRDVPWGTIVERVLS